MRKHVLILSWVCAVGLTGCGGGDDATDAAAVVTDPSVAALGASMVPSDTTTPTLDPELIPDFAADAATASGFPAELLAPIS